MKTYIVDSFTDVPFKGNPAGVCFPGKEISEQQMLSVAAELGFSETAFVWETQQEGVYDIRYFSPKQEIPLCGHATLAAAKILFTTKNLNEIQFHTIENLNLPITGEGNDIVMEFPVYDVISYTVPPALLAALGIKKVVNTTFNTQKKIILLQIADAKILADLRPNFTALVQSYYGINGVLVTAPGKDDQYDFHYRYFWPWAGTNEDPVTGGVQTFLAKYWSNILGKETLNAFQSSSRTGRMVVVLEGDKVKLRGEAVIVLSGEMSLKF